MKKCLTILLFFPVIASAQMFGVSISNGSGTTLDSAKFVFMTTSHAVPGVGRTAVFGNPNTSVVTGTSGRYSITTVATANWPGFSGSCSYDNLGMLGATFFPDSVFYR